MRVPGSDISGFELAAALDAYEEQLASLRFGRTPSGIALLQRSLRRICQSCASLPQLTGATVDLVLSHHLLLVELMRLDSRAGAPPGKTRVQAVEGCIRSLQRQSREMFLAPRLH